MKTCHSNKADVRQCKILGHELPGEKGTYVLILSLSRAQRLRIGSLGTFSFQRGFYAYAGSAFGPGGLRARLAHHQSSSSRCHWHIDYLRKKAIPKEVWYTIIEQRLECEWAAVIQEMPFVSPSVKGFGVSDCDCKTHLFFSEVKPSVRAFKKCVDLMLPYFHRSTNSRQSSPHSI